MFISQSYSDLWASAIVHVFFPVCPDTCGATVWMCERLQWVWGSGAQTDRERPPFVWMFDPPPSSAVRPIEHRLTFTKRKYKKEIINASGCVCAFS